MKKSGMAALVGGVLAVLFSVGVAGWAWQATTPAVHAATAAARMSYANEPVIMVAGYKMSPKGGLIFEPDYRPLSLVTDTELSGLLSQQESGTCSSQTGSCCTPLVAIKTEAQAAH